MKTDAHLKNDVEAELDWDPSVHAPTIGVTVRDGIVTLTGHLSNYAEKLAAEEAAQRVAGVRGVAVEIDVRVPGSSRKSDAQIAAMARDALRGTTTVPDDRIQVTIEDALVTLSGDVDWSYQRIAAEKAVRSLVGVRGVNNQICVGHRLDAKVLKCGIEAALKRAAAVDADTIQVAVVDGVVTLDGLLHSLAERRTVIRAVWAAPGVQSVIDHIHLVP